MSMSDDVVIVSAARTPVGSFNGAFATTPMPMETSVRRPVLGPRSRVTMPAMTSIKLRSPVTDQELRAWYDPLSAAFSEDFPEEDHIVFSVVERPEQQIGFYSTEMSEYLRTKGGNPIDVTFEITSDYGRARAFNAMKIGDLILWIDSKNPLPSGPA
jgi:hypothetical protein